MAKSDESQAEVQVSVSLLRHLASAVFAVHDRVVAQLWRVYRQGYWRGSRAVLRSIKQYL